MLMVAKLNQGCVGKDTSDKIPFDGIQNIFHSVATSESAPDATPFS